MSNVTKLPTAARRKVKNPKKPLDAERDNIEFLSVDTYLQVPVSRVLEQAKPFDLKRVLILGELEDGNLYMSFSDDDRAELLWMIENAKREIMDQ